MLPRIFFSISPNALRKFSVIQYSNQNIHHTSDTSVWIIKWLPVRIDFVAPRVPYTSQTFPGTSRSLLKGPHKPGEDHMASVCDWYPNGPASSSGESHFTELLSHSCLAFGCPSLSGWETISWNVNLALQDNMLLKSDKKEKLSWVQTDCLCSQVLKMHS